MDDLRCLRWRQTDAESVLDFCWIDGEAAAAFVAHQLVKILTGTKREADKVPAQRARSLECEWIRRRLI